MDEQKGLSWNDFACEKQNKAAFKFTFFCQFYKVTMVTGFFKRANKSC